MEFVLPNINIEEHRSRASALEQELSSATDDYTKLGKLNAEYKQHREVISVWEKAQSLLEQYQQTQELQGTELADLADQEIATLEAEIPMLLSQLEDFSLIKLKNDENNAIFEIRAGTGGTEAALFAEEVFRMYLRYLNSQGFTVETMSTSYENEAGIKEVIFRAVGPNAFGKMRFESGVHRVQRVPVTEASGRIHTSTISIVILPEVEEEDIEINEQDLRIDVYRSSGPGGQSVNTTDSAVRVLHKPTGLIVTCQDSKSQHKNKEKAMSILYSRLYAIEEEKQAKEAKDLRLQAIQGGDRSAKIRTYNFPQGRITDHRVKMSWFNIAEAMEGNIDDIVTSVNKELRKQLAS